jgi:hypothetical protein
MSSVAGGGGSGIWAETGTGKGKSFIGGHFQAFSFEDARQY